MLAIFTIDMETRLKIISEGWSEAYSEIGTIIWRPRFKERDQLGFNLFVLLG